MGTWRAAPVVVLAVLTAAGCGESEGVAAGASVTVYASAPLCAGAKRELARQGQRAGTVEVHVACLAPVEGGGRIDLARIGANARRAVQDTTTVGYLAEPDPAAARFSRPILQEAGVPEVSAPSGAVAMRELLKAIGEAGSSGSLRESVLNALDG